MLRSSLLARRGSPASAATLASLALALIAGCGDDAARAPDAGPPDAPGDGGEAAAPRAVVVAGDFDATGVLSVVDVRAGAVTPDVAPGAVGGDPYLRRLGGELLVVNRDKGNNVTILDAATLRVVAQLGAGAGANPQDVAVHGAKLYVPALGTAGVVVLTRGETATKLVSLASLDPDGKPDCVSAYAVGDDVYVACGLLDESFAPRGPGKIAVIDATTDQVRATFDLPFANPQGLLTPTPAGSPLAGDLVIATVPSFTDYGTGCLARVRPGATPAAAGCAVTNAVLDGFPAHVAVDPAGGALWLALTHYDASFDATGALRRYDLATGALAPPLSAPGQLVTDVAACSDGHVVVADRAMGAAGVRLFTAAGEQTTAPLPIGLPPGYGNGMACD